MTTNSATPDYSLFIRPGLSTRPPNVAVVAFVNGLTDGIPQPMPVLEEFKNGPQAPIRQYAQRIGRMVTIRQFGNERWVCAIKPEDQEAVALLAHRRPRK